MTSRPITVLHVDDDDGFRTLLRDFLHHEFDDISVVPASDSEEALARLAEETVDCVVTDYEMPGTSGLGLLETVRERWPRLPVILFTGRGDEETAIEAINLGATDYLRKQSGLSQYTILANRIRNAVAHYRAEREVRTASHRTEAQFEHLVDAVEDYAIFLLDEDGHVRTWNRGAEKIKGFTRAEIVGKHFSTFYREEDVAAGVPDRLLREATTEGRVHEEGWRVQKDGSEFWADVTITALYEGNELVGYAKVTHDITQRHRERLLLEQNEQLHGLIAALSHDLRNPLAVAQGHVELAVETGDLSHLDEITRALERADELLDHLSRLAQEDRRITDPEPVDLREVVTASWDSIETGNAELRIDGIDDDAIVVVADRQRLQQLLENLLQNCVEHAGSGPTIVVGRLDDTGFYVEDDGPGVPAEERSKVFEMGHSSDPDGTGFGLAICKQIVDAHGWRIDVTDGSDGGGRFEVTDIELQR